jgi:hypothetical protein
MKRWSLNARSKESTWLPLLFEGRNKENQGASICAVKDLPPLPFKPLLPHSLAQIF